MNIVRAVCSVPVPSVRWSGQPSVRFSLGWHLPPPGASWFTTDATGTMHICNATILHTTVTVSACSYLLREGNARSMRTAVRVADHLALPNTTKVKVGLRLQQGEISRPGGLHASFCVSQSHRRSRRTQYVAILPFSPTHTASSSPLLADQTQTRQAQAQAKGPVS